MTIVPYLCVITNLNFDDLMKRNLSENCETALQDSKCVVMFVFVGKNLSA